MDMFEVLVYNKDNRVIRKSLVQATHKMAASREALNVYRNTPNADRFSIEG
jgi:hypothetical protein